MTAIEQPERNQTSTFLEQLPVIDRIIGIIARRNALDGAVADDFGAWARARLLDNDCAILRKFGGRSTLATYLSVVLSNLYRDYRNHLWGRWRPSAAAQRMGPIGIRLDELLHRDSCPLREAIGILRQQGAVESDGELARMAARLPRHVTDSQIPVKSVADSLADPATPRVSSDERQRVEWALQGAVSNLPDEDRIITRMRFWDGLSVADIARTLRIEQKPLYRRVENIQQRLRDALASAGITAELARDVLSEEGLW